MPEARSAWGFFVQVTLSAGREVGTIPSINFQGQITRSPLGDYDCRQSAKAKKACFSCNVVEAFR